MTYWHHFVASLASLSIARERERALTYTMINEYRNFSSNRLLKANQNLPVFSSRALLSWLKVSIYLIETKVQKLAGCMNKFMRFPSVSCLKAYIFTKKDSYRSRILLWKKLSFLMVRIRAKRCNLDKRCNSGNSKFCTSKASSPTTNKFIFIVSYRLIVCHRKKYDTPPIDEREFHYSSVRPE